MSNWLGRPPQSMGLPIFALAKVDEVVCEVIKPRWTVKPVNRWPVLWRRLEIMRADRLVAILLLLQTRGQVTAAEVAEELEVSERTARRDLDALGMAGLPIYSLQGRNGGWRLAGDGKTDLSGLSASEVRALFLLAGPATATPEIRAALRKLVRALPEPMRADAQAATTAMIVDTGGWDRNATQQNRAVPEFLDIVQKAVITGMQAALAYVARDGSSSTRNVHPLGVAAQSSIWYLVADTENGMRTFRIDRMRAFDLTKEPVVRPEGFALQEAWKLITDQVNEKRLPMTARCLVAPNRIPILRSRLGTRLRIGGPIRSAMSIPPTSNAEAGDQRIEIEVRGFNEVALAGDLAGFGNLLEVLEPPVLRERLAQVAQELLGLYQRPDGLTKPPE
jgi:predicted DNA-binding transcriptional regulator YafY